MVEKIYTQLLVEKLKLREEAAKKRDEHISKITEVQSNHNMFYIDIEGAITVVKNQNSAIALGRLLLRLRLFLKPLLGNRSRL